MTPEEATATLSDVRAVYADMLDHCGPDEADGHRGTVAALDLAIAALTPPDDAEIERMCRRYDEVQGVDNRWPVYDSYSHIDSWQDWRAERIAAIRAALAGEGQL